MSEDSKRTKKGKESHGGTDGLGSEIHPSGPMEQFSSTPPGGAAERSVGGNAALGTVPDSAALPPARSGWRGLARVVELPGRRPSKSTDIRDSLQRRLPAAIEIGPLVGCVHSGVVWREVCALSRGVTGFGLGWWLERMVEIRPEHGHVLPLLPDLNLSNRRCWLQMAQVVLACRLHDRWPAQSCQSGSSKPGLGWPALFTLLQSDDGPLYGYREWNYSTLFLLEREKAFAFLLTGPVAKLRQQFSRFAIGVKTPREPSPEPRLPGQLELA